jgi:RNA polymerase sigma-54 factor
MSLEIKQQLRLSQQLVMTPQLQQAIKLLQLSRMDLMDQVREELMENPMLEEFSEIEATPPASSTEQEVQRSRGEGPHAHGLKSNDERREDVRSRSTGATTSRTTRRPRPGPGAQRLRDDDLPGVEATLSKKTTLFDHLIWQLQVSDFTDQEKRVASHDHREHR